MTKIKKKFINLIISILLITALGFSLFGCSSNNSTKQTNQVDSSITVSLPATSEPEKGFDPINGWGAGEHMHDPLIQSTLIKNNDGEIVPDMATSWSLSNDARSLSLTLRDNANCSNGYTLKASDVVFTLTQLKNSVNTTADLENVESIKALSDTEVQIDLVEPNNLLLYTLSYVGIVPEKFYNTDYAKNPIGSGAYKLSSYRVGEQAILEANENYYGDAPSINKVTVLFAEEDTSLNLAKSGDVDVAYTSATYANQDISDYNLTSVKAVDNRGISLPTNASDNPVTSDVSVRSAMNYGCDKKQMIENTLNGHGKIAYSVCDGMPWYSDDMEFTSDKDKAESLLENSGWKLNGDYREKDGAVCEVNLWYAAGDSLRQAMSFDFRDQMKEIGIKVNLKSSSWDEIYEHQYTDLVFWGWGSTTPLELVGILKSDSESNFAKYRDANIDNHLKNAVETTDHETSMRELKLAQYDKDTNSGVNVDTGASWIWLANIDHLYFVKNGVDIGKQQLHPHGHGWSLLNNVNKWSKTL